MSRGVQTTHSARLMYAASETHADMLYATRLMVPDPFLWMSVEEKQYIVVSQLEVGRALKEVPPGIEVVSWQQARERWCVASTGERGPETLIAAVTRQFNIDQWKVPADFPLGLARSLEEHDVHLEPTTPFFPSRQHKNRREIQEIREGVALAEIGMEHALTILREARVVANGNLSWRGTPLTAEILRGEIDAEIARHGGTASHTIAAPGPQSADPHQCGHGRMRAREPIVIDIFPRVDRSGYHGDLTRTVVKGDPSETVSRAFTAVHDAREKAIAAARPGVAAAHVHAVAAKELADHGFETDTHHVPPRGFIHATGHGLGLEVHEPPRASETSEAILEDGHVITIEPGLYYPEWGGVRLEDVIVIQEDGCENLTSIATVVQVD
ncbi:MAG: M24 family metallopeptidase [Candidatus Pacebacteria bacterium]|nr:M24 family metallopeptidase [Candidatus Paceibacterota bacterium]